MPCIHAAPQRVSARTPKKRIGRALPSCVSADGELALPGAQGGHCTVEIDWPALRVRRRSRPPLSSVWQHVQVAELAGMFAKTSSGRSVAPAGVWQVARSAPREKEHDEASECSVESRWPRNLRRRYCPRLRTLSVTAWRLYGGAVKPPLPEAKLRRSPQTCCRTLQFMLLRRRLRTQGAAAATILQCLRRAIVCATHGD